MSHFEHLRSHAIPALQASVEDYLAPVSGARHIHLSTSGAEMAFLVAFPTVPDASDGRAHILEHLALCGSQRYPVRDPFFAMLRRSTATFMNAFTYADRTVYPFVSTDENDFFNLLDVYLDAAFFPKLDYLNFLQEGWRYTLDDGKLGYQGVVFNEMKGAFADPGHALYKGLTSTILSGTTYEVDSGGDPLAIPELTHQMLKDFHASHYHPSQAIFMTAGPLPAAAVQARIAERVLARQTDVSARRIPQLASAFAAPQRNTVRIPSQQGRDNEFGLQITWLMNESAIPKVAFEASLLSAGLLGDAAAPLMKAMETAGYGRPSGFNGHDDSARQMLFHVGMEGLTEAQVATAEALLWTTLDQVAEQGVSHATLQAALRDLKYQQRNTRSGGMPNVLERLLIALPVAMRDGDVMTAFDSDAILQEMERDIADPAYFKSLVRNLLTSPGRLVSTIVPDAGYFSDRDALETARLAQLSATLTDADRARIAADSAALDAHQKTPFDTQVLPRIRPGDVSAEPRSLPAIDPAAGATHVFSIGSNGISSASVVYDVSAIPAADWSWLALYAQLRDELGLEGLDYAEAGAWRQRMVPSFRFELQPFQLPSGALQVDLAVSASGLREEHANIAEVLGAYLARPRFDEHVRLGYLIERTVENTLDDLAQAGSGYASLAVSAPLAPVRRFQDAIAGPTALAFTARLKQLAATPDGLAQVAAELARMHAAVLSGQPSILCAGSGDDGQALARLVEAAIPVAGAAPDPVAGNTGAAPHAALPLANVALHAAGQVNHCSIAWAAPMAHHPDAGALSVAAELLTNQVLHTALREAGGAYGGNASYGGDSGVFSMSSYRDPRLAATYRDFDAAIDTLLDTDYSDEQLEEAIIGVIKALDKPEAPWDAVRLGWRIHRRGTDLATRQRFRQAVLGCTLAQVKAVVLTYLKNGDASRAAFAGNTTQDLAGLTVVDLSAAAGA
ncbi:insulinase family protein [Massilia aurea]|uniref:insulinase family protein n=1 Tax=Massilia aurea TaxID=373040 RepID=UPI0034632021